MFELKKILGAMLMPLPLFGLICALCFLIALRNNKVAAFTGLLVTCALMLISTPFMGQKIVDPSTQLQYVFNSKNHSKIDKIVVLGCDLIPNPNLSANSQLGNCAKSRLVEGIRLAYLYPHAQLIVSGGGYGKVTNSHLMQQTAISLGVKANRIKQNPAAMDTADEAKFLAPALVDFKVVLVTSSSHMRRAKDLFNAQGVDVIPAATDFYDYSAWPVHKQYVPNVNVLLAVTRQWHEVIGRGWIAVRRWIDPEAL
ncbi:YdcF family protein [Pseudoalteromonas neustonica]|uniref:YdcF family protein n=1 Tax=Pseudoalteromonas neustonica TaxID=1840331 RepID=UPI0007DAF660|nr:ElyC/SanA/YdcF family protein [Pseudoalteromonas neustonica]